MKIINTTSSVIRIGKLSNSEFLLISIKHTEKNKFETQYRGGGWLSQEPDCEHFTIWDKKETFEDFCLIPENDNEREILRGFCFNFFDGEDESIVVIPKDEFINISLF